MRRGWIVFTLLVHSLWAAPLRAQVSPVDTQIQINTAVQDALGWTGLYDTLADGAIGEKSIAAIAEFQRRQGWAPTGDLDPAQKMRLLQIADAARRNVGFQLVNDPRAALAIALPTRLLAARTDTPHGSRYTSADGQVEVYLARFRPEERTLSALYSTVIGSSSMTGITYKLLRRDAFFVAGFNDKRDLYHSARTVGGEVRGFTIAYPRVRAPEFGPIIVAMSNSFKAPMVDYAEISEHIRATVPHVAGSVQRAVPADPPVGGRRPGRLVSTPMPSEVAAHTKSPADLFERVKDSVWVVVAVDSIPSVRDDAKLGSAVAISSNEVVTNCHVVGKKPIIGLVQGKTVLRARISSANPANDRCVLAAEGKLSPVAGVRPFQDLRVGERVYTIGSPRGLERTLGEGLISGLRSASDGNFVQTTAPISSGSSGGGLFDDRGNLIGVTTFLLKESQALNFAIAADEFWR